MKLAVDAVERIQELGYKEPEARFLYIVAVHSGYFTLAQFRRFTDTCSGRQSTSFGHKVLKQGHATVRDYMSRGSVFHLFSQVVYGQVDEFDIPNRKKHSFDFMRARLLLLDFILCNLELDYFETEQDKIRFFCEDLAIPKGCLPNKIYQGQRHLKPVARYFVDRFPMFLSVRSPSAPAMITLSYVDSGSERLSKFSSHLTAYRQLFRELNCFRFLYIASKDVYFRRAADRFRAVVESLRGSQESNEILRYFQIREKWERREYVSPVAEDFEFLNRARKQFEGERVEALFRLWTSQQISDTALCLEYPNLEQNSIRQAFFDTFLVKQGGRPLAESFRGGERSTPF
jgi:hypothetical protein